MRLIIRRFHFSKVVDLWPRPIFPDLNDFPSQVPARLHLGHCGWLAQGRNAGADTLIGLNLCPIGPFVPSPPAAPRFGSRRIAAHVYQPAPKSLFSTAQS